MHSRDSVAVEAARASASHSPADFRDLPPAAAGAQIMLAQWDRALAHEPGVRTGHDIEDVHRMRVAFRRLRAAIRVFGDALQHATPPGFLERLRDDVREVARALGAVRDLDVALEALAADTARAPEADRPALARLHAAWEARRDTARQALLPVLDGEAMVRLRTAVEGTIRPLAGARCSRHRHRRATMAATAPRLVRRGLRRFRRRGRCLLAASGDELHALRIEAKRLRYTAEFMAAVFGGAEQPFVALITDIQDALGVVHDSDVAVSALLEEIEGAAGSAAEGGAVASFPGDAGAYARLVRHYLGRREVALSRFRALWTEVPRPKALRRTLAKPARMAPHQDDTARSKHHEQVEALHGESQRTT